MSGRANAYPCCLSNRKHSSSTYWNFTLATGRYKRIEFWKLLLHQLNKRTNAYKNVSPKKENWLEASAGTGGVSFSIVIRMNNAPPQFVLNKEKDLSKKMFDFLYSHRSDIEKSVGETLTRRRIDEQKSSIVQFEVVNVGLADETIWETGAKLLAENVLQLYYVNVIP